MWKFHSLVFTFSGSTISAKNIITAGHFIPDATVRSDHPTFAFASAGALDDDDDDVDGLWPERPRTTNSRSLPGPRRRSLKNWHCIPQVRSPHQGQQPTTTTT